MGNDIAAQLSDDGRLPKSTGQRLVVLNRRPAAARPSVDLLSPHSTGIGDGLGRRAREKHRGEGLIHGALVHHPAALCKLFDVSRNFFVA